MAASLMTAAVRRGLAHGSAAPSRGAFRIARRSLGDTVRGPPITDLAANLKLAKDFFSKDAISYLEYKQQCVSLRLFAFGAVTLGCVTALFVSPPKSSYWATFGPGYCFAYVKGCFSPETLPLFLDSKLSPETDVKRIVATHLNQNTKKKVGATATGKVAKIAPAKEAEVPAKETIIAPAQPADTAEPSKAAAPVAEASTDADAALLNRIEELERRLNELQIEAGSEKHAAFVFIKPHAVCDKVKYLMELKLRNTGISVISEGSIAAEKIDENQLIDTHYGAIAAKAVKLKPDALTVQPKAQEAFESTFGAKWKDAVSSGQVYNAMDGAKKLGLTSDELNAKWSTLKKDVTLLKFGGGFYCGKVDDIFVINGFYMDMRSKFTAPGTSIYYYEVEWNPQDLSWADFREKILGGTDPKTAHVDSARHMIYSNWEGLGLKSCPNTGDNGVHASASPFEALSERCNWLGRSLSGDFFGRAMLASGVPADMLKAWCDDPAVNFDGKKQSIFDLLEDLNAEDCLKKSGVAAKANR